MQFNDFTIRALKRELSSEKDIRIINRINSKLLQTDYLKVSINVAGTEVFVRLMEFEFERYNIKELVREIKEDGRYFEELINKTANNLHLNYLQQNFLAIFAEDAENMTQEEHNDSHAELLKISTKWFEEKNTPFLDFYKDYKKIKIRELITQEA